MELQMEMKPSKWKSFLRANNGINIESRETNISQNEWSLEEVGIMESINWESQETNISKDE